MKKKESAFTLIEIMVVVVILGIVATVVVANIGDKPIIAKVKLTTTQLKRLKGDVELFKADMNRYPETLQEMVPKYLSEVPLDGWERPFIYYRAHGTRGSFEIVSYGDDGKEGGEGYNADLSSHSATK